MASELNMYESQVADHKMDIERLSRELQEVKKKYYLQKKKEHIAKYVDGRLVWTEKQTLLLFHSPFRSLSLSLSLLGREIELLSKAWDLQSYRKLNRTCLVSLEEGLILSKATRWLPEEKLDCCVL